MKLTFVRTCYACPEQYDAYLYGKQVGYLRLRHGRFTVDCPGADDKEVYNSETPRGDRLFHEDERDFYLSHAAVAIMRNLDIPISEWDTPLYEIVETEEFKEKWGILPEGSLAK